MDLMIIICERQCGTFLTYKNQYNHEIESDMTDFWKSYSNNEINVFSFWVLETLKNSADDIFLLKKIQYNALIQSMELAYFL